MIVTDNLEELECELDTLGTMYDNLHSNYKKAIEALECIKCSSMEGIIDLPKVAQQALKELKI